MTAIMNVDVMRDEPRSLELPPEEKKKSKKQELIKEKVDVEVSEGDEEFVPEKSRKKRQLKPEPVYIIPDVEHKETTFKGRLGAHFTFQRL